MQGHDQVADGACRLRWHAQDANPVDVVDIQVAFLVLNLVLILLVGQLVVILLVIEKSDSYVTCFTTFESAQTDVHLGQILIGTERVTKAVLGLNLVLVVADKLQFLCPVTHVLRLPLTLLVHVEF